MIFEQDALAFEILDVFRVRQKDVTVYNTARNFDALSFRIHADTSIQAAHKSIHLGTGSIAFFPAKVDYTRTTKEDDLIVIHFHSLSYYASDIEHFTPKDAQKYQNLFNEALTHWQEKDLAHKHEVSALLCRIFAECLRDVKNEAKPRSRIEASLRYIDQSCLEPDFSLTRAASLSFVSETYFRRLFHKERGTTPKQYVLHRRLKHAAALLQTGYYTVGEIAHLCGYRDEKYFSVEFKRTMGVSPSKYAYAREFKNVT